MTGLEPAASCVAGRRSNLSEAAQAGVLPFELLPLNFVRLPFDPERENAWRRVSFLFPRDIMPMVHDGATEVTYNEPEYCEQHILDSWRHWDIMPQAGCERETAHIQTDPLLKAVSGAKTAPVA